MSYLSTTENVGFSGLPQNISDASCATQYKMAVEGVSGGSEVNIFIHDSSGDEQTYMPHLNENFFHTKFKIDPNELYTFHDSDVIAGEITVSHTEDNFIFDNDVKTKELESPNKEFDLIGALSNGEIKEIKKEVVSNGHYPHPEMHFDPIEDVKPLQTKVKARTQSLSKEQTGTNIENRRSSVHSPKSLNSMISPMITSISSVTNNVASSLSKTSGSETFLDVFKREQGVVDTSIVKTEPGLIPPSLPAKVPVATPPAATKKASSGKASQSKSRKGRGPAVHEALQRIPSKRVVPLANRTWHAPGEDLFTCGPLDDKGPNPFRLESSSSDDDALPDFESGSGAVCVEENEAESRGTRLALRRAALRRHVTRADNSLRLSGSGEYREHRTLAALIKKQLSGKGQSFRLPSQTVNHLLAMRGMPVLLTSQERRRLREDGWSGGESGTTDTTIGTCAEERCTQAPLPCGRYCLTHVTSAPEQRLYAACAAVFAGGQRCKQPLLPLQDQTPLCPEHAWKRDNYDKLSRDCRPKKPPVARKRPCPPTPRPPRPPRRPKRRRRPTTKPRTTMPSPAHPHSLSDVNICSNSSTYDSSEDTTMGGLSESEYIVTTNNSHELEVEVGHVPPDDILDPAVLSQIPDEAFTEFFNQAEGGTTFAEGSELAAALEAVLDERALDTIADCVFTQGSHVQIAKNKVQAHVEMPSSAPS